MAPTQEVAVRTPAMTLADKLRYAESLAQSGLLPSAYRKQPANVLYAVEYGDMLGLSTMAAITGIHVIEGKPTASAALISALVRSAGHRLRVTGNDTNAVAEIVRRDDPDFTFRSEWTMERAKKAELANKSNWKKYPAAMLKARAITEVARDACEEALCGVHYTPEELGAEVNEDGDPVTLDAELVPDAPGIDWDAEITKAEGDKPKLLELYQRAGAAGAPAEVVQRIVAAGKKAAQAADPAVVARGLFDRLMTVDSVTDADRLYGEITESGVGEVDVTDMLTPDDREVLAIDEATTVQLGVLAGVVADRIGKYAVPVRFLDDPQPAESAESAA